MVPAVSVTETPAYTQQTSGQRCKSVRHFNSKVDGKCIEQTANRCMIQVTPCTEYRGCASFMRELLVS